MRWEGGDKFGGLESYLQSCLDSRPTYTADEMASLSIEIPGVGTLSGEGPIVILGTNGSGKTRLAQQLSQQHGITSIGAQRRTWLDDALPVQEEANRRNNIEGYQNSWRSNAYQPTDEINYIVAGLVTSHAAELSRRNEEAIARNVKIEPLTDSNLFQLQTLWSKIYPGRKLDISGFFPNVTRIDSEHPETYKIRQMSDGERSVLYLSARVLDAPAGFVLVDEPELHLHSRLATEFWSEIANLRPDCRFIFITHDLTFTLSRSDATILIMRSGQKTKLIQADSLPASVASEILGAATLPFHASRIYFFEGEGETAFAVEFFTSWFEDSTTFALPAGNRDAVISAVAGLTAVGVAGAAIAGIIDRDFYSDEALAAVPAGIEVLKLHEIESVLCDPDAIRAIARHLGKSEQLAVDEFKVAVSQIFVGRTLNNIVAQRVRARINDLMRGAFGGQHIEADLNATTLAHARAIEQLGLTTRVEEMFTKEEMRVAAALNGDNVAALQLLPGKHLVSILSARLGLHKTADLTSLVVSSLRSTGGKGDQGISQLGRDLEAVFGRYLPPRKGKLGSS